MDFINSLLFLLLLLLLIWTIKADFFFMVLGTVILLYFLFQLFFMDPLEIIFSIRDYFLINPSGVLILFIPLIISGVSHLLKKFSNSKTSHY